MRNKNIWIFNATNDFNGNVKYLFHYINKNNPEITAVWMCDSYKMVQKIRKLGYKAYLYSSSKSEYYKENAGVFVVHQVKQHFPIKFNDEVIVLNLWHGVGLKPIERYVDSVGIKEATYKKYIKYNSVYRNNQLFLVTSKFMEDHFKKYLKLDDEQLIRGAYPVNKLRSEYKTNTINLDTSKTIVLYAPTFRDANINGSFSSAIPDIDKLLEVAKKQNLLIIFKMHYLVNNDTYYTINKKKYADCEHFLFWDDSQDVYEEFDKIDVALIDYSSIYYDLINAGVKTIRYIYDYQEYLDGRPLAYDYFENTSGPIAEDFDQLLSILSEADKLEYGKDNQQINDKFWEYEKEFDMDDFVKIVKDFEIKDTVKPNLYSFDIFDTILQRKSYTHIGIFFGVGELAKKSGLNIPSYVSENYARVREQAESQVRDYYKKSHDYRKSDKREVQLIEIIEHMQELYDLSDEQKQFLFETECKLEIECAEPKRDKLDELLELLDNGEKVVLISDMYLPEDTIRLMLDRVDPRLRDVDLFLSSTYGYQKTTRKLYMSVFEELDYDYDEWIHYGDNHFADVRMAKQMGITAVHHTKSDLNEYEQTFGDYANTYDSMKIATIFMRFREQNDSLTDYYSFAYACTYFVPYLHWTIKDALKAGTKTLYFIARDGDTLKYIADSIIEANDYPIKTKYIYGSRKAWRIPSFINEIDEEFFSPYGNLQGITNFKSLLKALTMDEEGFDKIFPSLGHLKEISLYDGATKNFIKNAVRDNKEYTEYLLNYAAGKREIIKDYLIQEIDFDEKYAFVEYWGRGYTQTCLDRIINDIHEDKDTIFYYARSIYPTHGRCVRKNYSACQTSLIFVETLFNNVPYQSIAEYTKDDSGKIIPVIENKNYDEKLYKSMRVNIPLFVSKYFEQDYLDQDQVERDLYDFGINYFKANPTDEVIISEFSTLKDSVILFEPEIEYAPVLTLKVLTKSFIHRKLMFKTKSIEMSIAKSSKLIQFMFNFYKQHHVRIKKVAKTNYRKRLWNKIRKYI